MRFIEVGIHKFEVDGETISCMTGDEVLGNVGLSSEFVHVLSDNTNVVFRDAGVVVAFSTNEWDYLCGRIDALSAETVEEAPVEEAPVAEEAEATPVVAPTRRGRRRA
jgi:hypothetical protein